jgi:uncharacterized membrane protein
MTVRSKVIWAYVGAAVALVVALIAVTKLGVHRAFVPISCCAVAAGFMLYVAKLRCPHCGNRAFAFRWLLAFYVPSTCNHCDREFYD